MNMDQDKDQPGEHGPVRITDKREQRRQEAAARAAAAQHPVIDESVVLEGTPKTPTDEALDRIDRLHKLTETGRERDLTAEEMEELLRLQAEEHAAAQEDPNAIHGVTAFIVVLGHDGSAAVHQDFDALFVLDREANVNDFYTGAQLIALDVQAAMAAKHTVFGLNVSAQAMQQQAQAARMMQGLQTGGMPTGRRR